MSHLPTNKTMVYSLISANKQKVEPHILYETLRKMEDDLVLVYSTVLEGPLAAVDGFALFNLNAANLTGIVPRDSMPPEVAFEDEANFFTEIQSIVADDENAFLQIGFGDLVSDPEVPAEAYIRIGALSATRGYISHNLIWDGAAFIEDHDDAGFLIDLNDGVLVFHHYDGTDLLETFSFDAYDLSCRNQGEDATYRFVSLDANNVFLLGEDAAVDNSPDGYIGIPVKADTELPTPGAAADGIIVIDSVNNTLVYYVGGASFVLTGV